MDKDSNITFQDTVKWADNKFDGKNTRSKGIPIFYLIIGAVIILILIILIIYLIGRNPEEEDALDMMKDKKYLYDEDIYDNYSYSSYDDYDDINPYDDINDPYDYDDDYDDDMKNDHINNDNGPIDEN